MCAEPVQQEVEPAGQRLQRLKQTQQQILWWILSGHNTFFRSVLIFLFLLFFVFLS